ncbi:MAG: phage tail tube protein [Leclercia adecarboxylata]|nr:phage tail tube protein [Leclercia adecarboxylata]MDU1082771.1 phage tail tube protein [Leclercia adecarboxylata]
MSRIAGTTFIKVDSGQLSLSGGIEVPMSNKKRDPIVALDGSVHYKETFIAPYVKGTFVVPPDFPVSKLTESEGMTVTAELANGMVYVLREAWISDETPFNAEEGTADLLFNGKTGFFL